MSVGTEFARDVERTGKPVVPRTRLVPGGSFALDHSELTAVWGRPDENAWPEGEPALIVGPTGIGHTTLMHRLLLARAGIGSSEVLGLPVVSSERPVLLLAADRPRQARRSLRRMVTEADRVSLDERLIVWEGPPDFDLARTPERLAEKAVELGVGTVFIDALKDVAARLSEDETGSGLVRAWNFLLAERIEVAVNHHQRKATAENKRPKTLDDVYGSRWITAGAGSVLLLWGRPGDPVIEVTQLKQAVGEVGSFRVLIDFDIGAMTILEGTDPLALLRAASRGLTVKEAATALYGSAEPADREKARRQLDRLVNRGLAFRKDPAGEGRADRLRGEGVRYFAVALRESRSH